MSKLKKIFTIICTTALLFVCTISPACAADQSTTPYMEHIALGQCVLTVENNTAAVSAWVQGQPDVTKTSVEVEIQEQFLFFFWNTVDTWSKTDNDNHCLVSGSTTATSGKTYRAVATVTAWVGNDSETQTITTETVVAD